MKVQDIAKDLTITTRDMLIFLREKNVRVKSGSTKLDPGTTTRIKQMYKDFLKSKSTNVNLESRTVVMKDDTLKVGDLVHLFNVTLTEIMKVFLKKGLLLNVNSDVDQETALEIGKELNIDVQIDDTKEIEKSIGLKTTVLEIEGKNAEDHADSIETRPPVVTIMGHVDHGKTQLLDTIRQSNVLTKEAGGITQHIGAYQVDVNGKLLTFLDTPGHEAFTALRARGAQVTDIAILVVAGDDGVKPQTEEAIHHAQAADVPIIVAINKKDKPEFDLEKVKQQLSQHNLVSEDWGGSTVMVSISAKTGDGIPELLEMIALVADMQELKSSPKGLAKGVIIESNLSKQKGPVAIVLVKAGTLSVGDHYVVNSKSGKVRAMFNDRGERITQAKPGMPVELLGLSEVPIPGSILSCKHSEKEAKSIAEEHFLQEKSDKHQAVSFESLSAQIENGDVRQLNIVLKTDVNGSLEAIRSSIEKIESKDIPIKILHAATGSINENDVMLAKASSAMVLGFGVGVNSEAKNIAEESGVDIRTYTIIYQIVEDIEKVMLGLFKPEFIEVELGSLEVREIFKYSKVSQIAGCYVTDGKVIRNAAVKIFRDGELTHESKLGSLKRFREDVKEVKEGFECGIVIDDFSKFKEGDIVKCFELQEKRL